MNPTATETPNASKGKSELHTSHLINDNELEVLFQKYDIPEIGKKRIRRIRDELPARAVRTNAFSGKLRYPSQKMGFVLEAEAFSTEFLAIVEWDHDNNILEIYTQPAEPLRISYINANGRKITTFTTPDAFLITHEGFLFVECKTEEELASQGLKNPEKFIKLPDGTWHSPPAEAAAKALGCRFVIRSSKQNNFVLFENLQLLQDFFRKPPPPVPLEIRSTILSKLNTKGYVSAFELIHIEPRIAADDLYTELVAGNIFFPIDELRLGDQDTAYFFKDALTWQAHRLLKQSNLPERIAAPYRRELISGDRFSWDGIEYEILNPGKAELAARSLGPEQKIITLKYEEIEKLQHGRIVFHDIQSDKISDPTTHLSHASPKSLQEAVWRYQILFGDPDKDNQLISRKARVRAAWRRSYRDAEERYGNGFIGLLSNRRGSRKPKVCAGTRDLAEKVIVEDWETIRRKGRLASYGRYKTLAETNALDPVSYVTFCKYVQIRSGHNQDVKRNGEKAAYDTEPQYIELERTTPQHGTRVWHIGHIDHTPLPLKFVHSIFGDIVSVVWLTILVDAFTRKILAYYFSFDEPSYRSCMMVLRDCVRRHGRIHQIIVTDGGSEFQSVYYEQLLARLETTKRERKRGKPRYGSVCERVFGTSQTQFISNLLGSTDIVENHFRAISPEVDPSRHAIWVLDRFDVGFQEYIDNVYHSNHHSGIDMSPNAAEALSLKSHGIRSFRPIIYNDQFVAATCPGTARGKVKIQPDGVKINYRWFKSKLFNLPGILGTNVPARYDPWNSGTAYVFLNGKWEVVYSEFYSFFSGHTERQIKLITEAMLLMARKRNSKAAINAQTLAQFMMTIEGREIIAQQQRNDIEAQRHRQNINSPRLPPNDVAVPSHDIDLNSVAIPINKARETRASKNWSAAPLEDL